jgi:hypothetical protein
MSKYTKYQKDADAKKKATSDAEKEKLKGTDPQENMKGPVSSIVQNIKESAEENDAESKEEADKKKDANT